MWVFTNNASAVLSAPLAIGGDFVRLETGAGILYPDLSAGEQFAAVVVAADGRFEIVLATSKSGDDIFIERGQEGTPAGTFDIGSRFELRLTAASLGGYIQNGGGSMTGMLDMNGFAIRHVALPDPTTMGLVRLGNLRGMDAATTLSVTHKGVLSFPAGAKRPRIANSQIMIASMFTHIVFAWSGLATNIEPWWKYCDGSLDTPDLRNRFLLGGFRNPQTPPQPMMNDIGGAKLGNTDAGGQHNHTGATGGTQLTAAQVPAITTQSNSRQDATGATQSVTQVFQAPAAAQLHGHVIGASGTHVHAYDIMPPYYAVAYVMINPAGFDTGTDA